eukprot:TRINITY_DN31981_c0_g1_i1.p1 TRINITY_DN31981_c0_g1~~TRINITY_DN31981_c0_g1_i1.p1  ORF type:complete len:315 (+),score=47.35 TRINITY_DN31981_c0_g1_i1:80-1024(+)
MPMLPLSRPRLMTEFLEASETTPHNVPTTHWRTVVTPHAPGRERVGSEFAPLSASPKGTPPNVATTTWRCHTTPGAPLRREVRLSSTPSPLMSPTAAAVVYSPIHHLNLPQTPMMDGSPPSNLRFLWQTASGDVSINSATSSPIMMFAPQPRHIARSSLTLDSFGVGTPMSLQTPSSGLSSGNVVRRCFPSDASATPASRGSPAFSVSSSLNNAFLMGSPISSIGGDMSMKSGFGFDAASAPDPFYVDATPIAKVVVSREVASNSPQAFFSPYAESKMDQDKVQEATRRPLGLHNPNTTAGSEEFLRKHRLGSA